MLDILSLIPGKKRYTAGGWYSFNAVCCHHNGHNRDQRFRGGVKFSDDTNWSYHCFNCGFKCGLTVGKQFSSNLRLLLDWLGMDKADVDRLSFKSFSQRSALELYRQAEIIKTKDFHQVSLPRDSRPLDPERDIEHVTYLSKRGIKPTDYNFYVIDGEVRQRIIIPYYYNGQIVGNTSRYYDNRHPKYVSEQQSGYVFNLDNQHPDWQVCVAVEGQFDAISIGGCAYMGKNINDDQAALFKKLHRKVIVVPDQDKAGLEICDRALELGFSVSIPNWDSTVKDVNDAVIKYGKFPTLLSILQSATTSRIIVEMKRKKLL